MSGNNIMNMKLLIFLFTLLLSAPTFAARTVTLYEVSAPSTVLTLTVDSIDFRQDLTRLYGKLTGRPHTSHRVDAATILSGKSSFAANDIDGVDFKRYFQWEDDGCIPVEIDFPAMRPFKAATIQLDTPRGNSLTSVRKSASRK